MAFAFRNELIESEGYIVEAIFYFLLFVGTFQRPCNQRRINFILGKPFRPFAILVFQLCYKIALSLFSTQTIKLLKYFLEV